MVYQIWTVDSVVQLAITKCSRYSDADEINVAAERMIR